MKRRNVKQGFTLIELIVVIAVLGVLAAIAIPTSASMIPQAKRSVCEVNRNTLQQYYDMYCALDPSYAADPNHLEDTDIATTLKTAGYVGNIITCPADGHYSLVNGIVVCSIHGPSVSGGPTTQPTPATSGGGSFTPTPSTSGGGSTTTPTPTSTSTASLGYVFSATPYYGSSGSFFYDLRILNNSSTEYFGWVFEFDYPGTINDIWSSGTSSTLVSLGNHRYRLTSGTHCYYIPPMSSSVQFSGSGTSWNGTTISNVVFRKLYTSMNATMSFVKTGEWSGTYQYKLTLTNNTGVKLMGWRLEFDYNGDIAKAYEGSYMTRTGNHYVFLDKSDDGASVIDAGGSLVLTGEGTTFGSSITNVKLNGESITLK